MKSGSIKRSILRDSNDNTLYEELGDGASGSGSHVLSCAGWILKSSISGNSGTTRSYSSVSLANNTIRTPSGSNDVLVIISPSIQAGIGSTSSIIFQIDNSGNGVWQTIATSSCTNAFTLVNILGLLLGGSSTQVQPISFKVPKSSRYRYITSGTVTILQHFELQE